MWHTKITRINWRNKFLFVIEDARVTFLSSPDLGHSHPPIWDSFHKVYFSGSSLSYLSGTRGQVTVQGVALWSITANCDCVLGINNQSMKTKLMLHITHYAVHGSNVWFISSLPPLKLTFIAESSFRWRLKPWAVINEGHGFREASLLITYWSVVIMGPESGLDPLLLARRTAILHKYEGLKTNYPELPSNLHDYQVSCSHLAYVRRSYFTLKTLTF